MLGGGAARSVIDLERRYGAANYDPLPVVLARGEGVARLGRGRAAATST